MFGGGVAPGENDPISLIRAPSVRGQLRYWWRATAGLQYSSARELREREARIWGSVDSGSLVVVEVRVTNAGKEISAEELRKDVGYAVFPFQESRKERKPVRKGRAGVTFDLTFRYTDDVRLDIIPAMWAFLNFGGIGARVRRGLGALYCPNLAPKSVDGKGIWFRQMWQAFKIPASEHRTWPVLGDAPLISNPVADARLAWAKAVGVLREFRQGYGVGRRAGPGRSFWPEADSLRMITGKGEFHHTDSLTLDLPGFPRAELGMPIVMHFKGPGDSPNDCIIEPAEPEMKTSRMASPIILRPLASADGKFVAMVLRLSAPKPSGVRIDAHDHVGGFDEIERPGFADYDNSPMKGTNGSALDAFMAFARRRLSEAL
jgi:CRISPR-associated protein Cmr1